MPVNGEWQCFLFFNTAVLGVYDCERHARMTGQVVLEPYTVLIDKTDHAFVLERLPAQFMNFNNAVSDWSIRNVKPPFCQDFKP